MPTHICTYPENLVKIGLIHSEIIGFQGTVKMRMKESNVGRTYSLRHVMPGGLNKSSDAYTYIHTYFI